MSILILFVFGLIIGSFLNVVLLRYRTERSIVIARSSCMHCGKVLGVLELVPIASFAVQAGKCRGCKTPLSIQYPLVELATGILFGFWGFRLGISLEVLPVLLIVLGISSLLILIFVYDLKHKIIPDDFSFPFIALAGFLLFIDPSGEVILPSLLDLLAGPLLFVLFYVLWAVSKGRWIGFGDVKFVWGIGWMLGIGMGLSSIVLSFWIGAVVSVAVLVWTRLRGTNELGFQSEVPFAPFLILGLLTTLVFGFDVLGLATFYGI